jgi:hypothetical protein
MSLADWRVGRQLQMQVAALGQLVKVAGALVCDFNT